MEVTTKKVNGGKIPRAATGRAEKSEVNSKMREASNDAGLGME